MSICYPPYSDPFTTYHNSFAICFLSGGSPSFVKCPLTYYAMVLIRIVAEVAFCPPTGYEAQTDTLGVPLAQLLARQR